MTNLKFIISYLGYGYNGWAKQINNEKTIQQTIENELSNVFNTKIQIYSSGRTDKFVHANNQVFSCKINELKIPLVNLKELLNKKLIKNNIFIKSIEIVNNDFNARFSAISKTYKYLINVGEFNLLENDLINQLNQKLNIKKMKIASKLFLGKHNFLSFSTSELENTIREINWIKIIKHKNIIEIYINANGFLRSMVRMLVAAMMNYSQDKINLDQIQWLLDNPRKGASIEKAKACGLYLEKVYYENDK